MGCLRGCSLDDGHVCIGLHVIDDTAILCHLPNRPIYPAPVIFSPYCNVKKW